MTKKEKSIIDILEKMNLELSKKEQAYVLGVIEGFKLAKICRGDALCN